MVEEERGAYEKAARFKRRRVAIGLRKKCNTLGMRFLKQYKANQWILANDDETEEKIRQLFRTIRKSGT